jgi:hypothetical protein
MQTSLTQEGIPRFGRREIKKEIKTAQWTFGLSRIGQGAATTSTTYRLDGKSRASETD